MKFRIRKCRVCHKYTLKEIHCGVESASAHPVKFSPQDKYAGYKTKVGDKYEN